MYHVYEYIAVNLISWIIIIFYQPCHHPFPGCVCSNKSYRMGKGTFHVFFPLWLAPELRNVPFP